ncbi:hypothetical protein AX17_000637 [Amanita inopinata Kibby_2008]|nr:hypothetical protein AX17_000637 [Amanita inopinata Kibby_2008]
MSDVATVDCGLPHCPRTLVDAERQYAYPEPLVGNEPSQAVLGITIAYHKDTQNQGLPELYFQQDTANSWSDYGSFTNVQTTSGQVPRASQAGELASNDLTLYAPIPLSGQPSLLFSDSFHCNHPAYYQHPPPSISQEPNDYTPQRLLPQTTTVALTAACPDTSQSYANAVYYQNDAPTQTFPTPSELLAELAGSAPGNAVHCDSNRNPNELARRSRRRLANRAMGLMSGESPATNTPCASNPYQLSRSARESISSHEKKRHYLECLEHYVMYLHQQLNLVGAEPVPLERVQSYRGLSNRSIRTLLVHMENTTRKLNMRTLTEEQRFVDLRDAVYRQDASTFVATQAFQIQKSSNTDESPF